jgi:hypothetical protein
MGWAITTAWQRIAALPQPPDQHEPRPSDPGRKPRGSKEPPATRPACRAAVTPRLLIQINYAARRSSPASDTGKVHPSPADPQVSSIARQDSGRAHKPGDHAHCLTIASRIPSHNCPAGHFWGGRCPGSAPGGRLCWRGRGGSPDPGAMLVARQLATGGLCLRSCRAPGWEVAGGHSYVPARVGIAGVGQGVAWISC